MRKICKILILSYISLIIFQLTGCEKLTEDYNIPTYKSPIKIGVVGDVSIGREVAENVFFATKMAADEINSSGGLIINGEEREIELIFKNSAGDPETGNEVVNELLKEGANIIVGPTTSTVAVEMAETCIANNVLMITNSATIPDLSYINDNNLIWRTCPSDAFSGKIMAMYSTDSLEFKNGAILFRDDNFGHSMTQIIQEKFESLGGQIVAKSSYPTTGELDHYNYGDEINVLLEVEPEIIFSIVFEEEIGKITQDLWSSSLYQDAEIKPYLFLTEGGFPNELIANGQPDILETIIGISSSITNTPNYITYENNYLSKYNFSPVTYSEHAYDAIFSIAYAIQKAQSISPEDIKQNLRLVTGNENIKQETTIINVNEFEKARVLLLSGFEINYDGASGKINFDSNGDPYSTFVIWGLENNEYVEFSYYNL
ncbi:MAG: ABC transporter substrate-binding protein [Bacteroidales bacterium]|nr:ABC transporter substrate-binding protein [Bacteroidales bacterium]